MSKKMQLKTASLVAALLLALANSACFTMKHHEIPMDAYFNHEDAGNAKASAFEDTRMKNYLISGLFPYSRFGVKDIVEAQPGRKITGLEVQTQFNALDVFVTIIPGIAYGYYIWAPRHISVKGHYLDGDVTPTIPARTITLRSDAPLN